MPKHLIDANLPYYFNLWKGDEHVHVFDLNPAFTDQEIWEYAKQHTLTIVTKDADFSSRCILTDPPPKVIHIRTGNMTLKEFYFIPFRI